MVLWYGVLGGRRIWLGGDLRASWVGIFCYHLPSDEILGATEKHDLSGLDNTVGLEAWGVGGRLFINVCDILVVASILSRCNER